MVKWPFSMVKWPPARGLKGHFESPGIGCLLLCFSLLYCFDRKHLATDSEDQLVEMENSSRPHLINFFLGDAMLGVGGVHVYVYIYTYLFIYAYIFSCIPEHRLRVLNPQVSASKLHDSFGMKNPGRSWGYPPKIFQQSEPNHKVIIEVQELNYC